MESCRARGMSTQRSMCNFMGLYADINPTLYNVMMGESPNKINLNQQDHNTRSMINRQSREEILDIATKIYDEQFIRECMVARAAEVKSCLQDDSISKFEVRTSKLYKPDYVSCTIRSQDDFDQLIDHVDHSYGGLIIPVLPEIDPEEEPDQAAEAYQIYLNELLENRQIRYDPVLFAFFFVQQHQSPYRSKYQRFLTDAIDLSRKHISQLFTRQDTEELIKYDKQLEEYRQKISQKRKKYEDIGHLIEAKCQQHQSLAEVLGSWSLPYSGQVHYRSKELRTKSERICTIFKQIEGAYQRRIVLKQHIKELKADAIRHKYNPKHESTQKLLQKQRHKHESWNQSLLKEIQCNIVVLDSLIKEVIMNYQTLQELSYEAKENPEVEEAP